MDVTIDFSDLAYDDSVAEEIAKDLNQSVVKTDRGKPYKIVIDSDHATMIEFGTNGNGKEYVPAPKGKGKPESQWSDAAKAIKKWIEARSHGDATSKDSYLVFKKIMEEGIPPQPFIRPAIHEIEMLLDMTDTFEKSTVKEIVEFAKILMVQRLQENFTLYDGGSIEDKILIEEVMDGDLVDNEPFLENLPPEIWDSDYMDLNGNEDRAKQREQNKDKLRFRT